MNKKSVIALCKRVMSEHPDWVQLVLNGKTARGFLVGEAIKQTQGKFPYMISKTMVELLDELIQEKNQNPSGSL